MNPVESCFKGKILCALVLAWNAPLLLVLFLLPEYLRFMLPLWGGIYFLFWVLVRKSSKVRRFICRSPDYTDQVKAKSGEFALVSFFIFLATVLASLVYFD